MKPYILLAVVQILTSAHGAEECSCWRCDPERTGRSSWSPSATLQNLVTSVKIDIDLTYASPILGPDSTIFVCSLAGDIRAFQKKLSPTASGGDFWLTNTTAYSLTWRSSTFPSTPILGTPAIAAGDAPGQYKLIVAAGSEVVAILGQTGVATFAEHWRVDLCGVQSVGAAWATQFGASSPCALRVEAAPAVAHDGRTAFLCGYGGAGPLLGACAALRAADGGVVWTSFINLAGFRSARPGPRLVPGPHFVICAPSSRPGPTPCRVFARQAPSCHFWAHWQPHARRISSPHADGPLHCDLL